MLQNAPTTPVPTIDPVCGMTVNPSSAPAKLEHLGHTYHFCNATKCPDKFRADPARYAIGAPPAAPTPVIAGATYTCPMHPEVVQDHPGSCPICGMRLEPSVVSLDDGPSHELIDMTRRLKISAALSAPLLALATSEMFSSQLLSPRTSAWTQFALSTPVVLWAGWPFFQRGGPERRSRPMASCSRAPPASTSSSR